MKQLTALILLAIPLAGFGQTARIREGTPMTFATVEALDASTTRVGDRVHLRLVKPVAVGGAINGSLLPAGMSAEGIVVKAQGAGRNKRGTMACGDGLLKISVDRVTLPDKSAARVRVVRAASQIESKGAFSRTVRLGSASRRLMTKRGRLFSSNLGPVPILLIAMVPIVAAAEGTQLAGQSVADLPVISRTGQPCGGAILPAGTEFTLEFARDQVVRLW